MAGSGEVALVRPKFAERPRAPQEALCRGHALDGLHGNLSGHGGARRSDLSTGQKNGHVLALLQHERFAVVGDDGDVLGGDELQQAQRRGAGVDEDAVAVLHVTGGLPRDGLVGADLAGADGRPKGFSSVAVPYCRVSTCWLSR